MSSQKDQLRTIKQKSVRANSTATTSSNGRNYVGDREDLEINTDTLTKETNRPTLSQRDISGGSGDSVAITGPQLPPTKKSVRSDGHASNRPVGLVDRSDSAISGMVAELSTSSLNEQMLTTAYHNTESLASLKSENDGSLASKSNSFRRSGDSRHRHNSNNSISSRDGASSTSGNVANAPPARAIKDLERLRLEIGLENLGNTCFMNSSLQCLLHIRPLAKFFLEEDLSKLVNVRSPMRGQLATSFAYLVRDVCDARDGTYISPLNFVKAVSIYAPHLLDFQQQDSQEFLRFLLDGMSEDLCRKNQYNEIPSPVKTAQQQLPMTSPTQLDQQLPIAAKQTQALVVDVSAGVTDTESGDQKQGREDNETPVHTPVLSKSPVGRMNSVERLRYTASTLRESGETDDDNDTATKGTAANAPSSSSRAKQSGPATNTAGGEDSSSTSNIAGGSNNVLSGPAQVPTTPRANSHGTSVVPTPSVPQSPKTSTRNIFPRGFMSLTARFASPRENSSAISSAMAADTTAEQSDARSDYLLALAAGESTESVGASGSSRRQENNNNNKGDPEPASSVNFMELSDKAWGGYLKYNDSIITDIFAGQLMSTIECTTCHNKSWCFDPFLDLSVPIPKAPEQRGFLGRRSQGDTSKCSLEECFEKFTDEEVLDGDNMVTCDHCKVKRKSLKKMSIFRYPRVLIIHIKRFRFSSITREKLLTEVNFPLTGLDLQPYLSPENEYNKSLKKPSEATTTNIIKPLYDLVGVSNHTGGLGGGHYIAHADTQSGMAGKGARWMCFNDARVLEATATDLAGPTAYVLFYHLRHDPLFASSENDQKIATTAASAPSTAAANGTSKVYNQNNNIIDI